MSDAVRPGPLEGALVWEEDAANGSHGAQGVPGEAYRLVPHLHGKFLVKHLMPHWRPTKQDKYQQHDLAEAPVTLEQGLDIAARHFAKRSVDRPNGTPTWRQEAISGVHRARHGAWRYSLRPRRDARDHIKDYAVEITGPGGTEYGGSGLKLAEAKAQVQAHVDRNPVEA